MKRTMRELRAGKRWTQKQTAERLNVSTQTYNAWENNPGMIKAKDANNIAHLFGVTLDDIFFTPKHENKSC